MAISSTSGSIGTYINIDALVQQAIYSKTNEINNQQKQLNSINTAISGLGKVKSSFSVLQDSIEKIKSAMNTYTYSNTPEGINFINGQVGNYSLEVTQLAQPQINTLNKTFSSQSLGYEGRLTINIGNKSNGNLNVNSTVDIDISPNDTLQEIRDKINEFSTNVKSTIINGNDGQYLSFSSLSGGADNAFEIISADSSLMDLTITSNGNNYKSIMQAQDGIANINGVNITSKDNDFKVGEGLEFTANKLVSSQKITIQQDKSKIIEAINSFVKQYNISATDLKNSGIKDRQILTFMDNLRKELTSGEYSSSLLSAGFSFDKSGILNFDISRFNKNNASLSIINSKLISSDSVTTLMDKFISYDGILENDINSLNEKGKKINNKIEDIQSIIDKQTTIYKNKYAQLDSYLGTLNGNLNSVTTLMGNLNIKA